MMAFDWNAVIFGLASGAVVSALFFAGLAFGMRMALRSARPIAVLVLSGALRIVALLGAGWFVVGQGGPWSLLGYAAAFFTTRFITTTIANIRPSGEAR